MIVFLMNLFLIVDRISYELIRNRIKILDCQMNLSETVDGISILSSLFPWGRRAWTSVFGDHFVSSCHVFCCITCLLFVAPAWDTNSIVMALQQPSDAIFGHILHGLTHINAIVNIHRCSFQYSCSVYGGCAQVYARHNNNTGAHIFCKWSMNDDLP